MINLCVAFTNADGNLSIVIPAPNGRGLVVDDANESRSETDDEFMARVIVGSVPPGTPYRVLTRSDLPADATFRNAWRDDAATTDPIYVDMSAAREIQRQRLREARIPELARLDIETMRAIESGDAAKVAEIAAAKQALRDATAHSSIAAAATPEDLALAGPAELVAKL